MFSFFKKSYPYLDFCSKYILSSFFIGLFVALFLIVFQPFDISKWETSYKTLKLIGFGVVSFVVPIIFKFIFDVVFKNSKREETWVIWKEVISILMVVCFIAIGNLCYSNSIHISSFEPKYFIFTFFATLILGIFPIGASVTIKYNQFLALNRKDAELMESEVLNFQNKLQENNEVPLTSENITEPSLLILIAENEKYKIELNSEDLLYIESADNYSAIVFIKNNQITKELIRGSLKRIESQIPFPFIIRCHRSYIVNLMRVNHIKGNAQGYRIEFKIDLKDTIPISRNFSKALFERLESLN
jgi:predicted neutral ceramidase superfamily lipid hydrolase